VRLAAENEQLSATFARDRISVSRLLAVLERLQHDMPPAMALKPDDALSAVRGAMLVGATLPTVYNDAAALARRIERLKQTRASLVVRKQEAARTAVALTAARGELDQLLAKKQFEATVAADRYDELAAKLAAAADQAANLQALLVKVARLRGSAAADDITVVTGSSGKGQAILSKGSLLRPVAGTLVPPPPGTQDPGLTFATPLGARVLAPADGKVLFAGPYHKSGQVLILELVGGYDLVLAGMDRVEVRPEDELLAGEPVGTMPRTGNDLRLYFVMRQNGREISPAPWMELEMRKANKS
jgi:septal ring factor EnvC (AmiA/AmiB activator)